MTMFHGGVDVTKYGIVGDGTTDDTQKLQSLINSSPNGTLFYFPAGTYLVSNTVHFSLADFGIVKSYLFIKNRYRSELLNGNFTEKDR